MVTQMLVDGVLNDLPAHVLRTSSHQPLLVLLPNLAQKKTQPAAHVQMNQTMLRLTVNCESI